MSEFDPLDAALAAAFGPREDSPSPSVFDRLRLQAKSLEAVRLRSDALPSRPAADPLPDGSGLRVAGRYRLGEEIARGGIGVILRGRDTDLGRNVAVKVLREEHATKPGVLQRFVEEAQIGGQLQHPGIVPVYELGMLSDRRPFFTMKMIEGSTLAELLHGRADPSAERLRFLTIFQAVCQTMAYAHARGVVHRDLKPANVMVGSFGEVLVVDWGLGKVLRGDGPASASRSAADLPVETVRSGSDSSQSIDGALLGTPAYMAPEQARGEVEKLDERTDVFALGAILCEIATGAPPYAGEPASVVAQAAAADLQSVRDRLSSCGADEELVAIAHACLSPDAGARPGDAGEVARRISAHLSAIEARGRTAQLEAAEARAKAMAERRARRTTTALAATVVAAVACGAVIFLRIAQERAGQRLSNESAALAALSDAALAETRGDWSAALSAAEVALALGRSSLATPELRGRVESAYAAVASAAAKARREQDLQRDNALLLSELLDVRQPERTKSYGREWADLDRTYLEIFARHGLHPELEDKGAIGAKFIERGLEAGLAPALDEWGAVRRTAKDLAGADRLWRIADACDPDPLRKRLRAAIAANDAATLRSIAAEIDAATQPALTLHLLGIGMRRTGSEPRETAEMLRRARLAHPGDYLLAMDLARRLCQLVPPSAEAISHFEAARAIRPDSVEAWHELGSALGETGQLAAAIALLESAVRRFPRDGHLRFDLTRLLERADRHNAAAELCLTLVEELPGERSAHYALVGHWQNAERLPELVEHLRRAAARSPRSYWARHDFGDALVRSGAPEEAIVELEAAIELDPAIFSAHALLGSAWIQAGRAPEAEEILRKAIELGPEEPSPQEWLGTALQQMDRADEAVEAFRRASDLDPTSAERRNRLGRVLLQCRRFDEGIIELQRSLDSEESASVAADLGFALAKARRNDEAQVVLQRAVELDPTAAGPHTNLGCVLTILKRYDEALVPLRRAIDLDPENPRNHDQLGRVFRALGLEAEAIGEYRRAAEIDPGFVSPRQMLARLLAIAEREDLRDPEQSLEHARAAVQLSGAAENLEHLGVALYANGRLDEARKALERAVELGGPDEGARTLFLSLCCQRAGDAEAARRWWNRSEPNLDALIEAWPELRSHVEEARAPHDSGGR